MSQQFYDNFLRSWKSKSQSTFIEALYDVSSNIGLGWEYIPNPYSSLMSARTAAQKFSQNNTRGVPELWRVSRGNMTIALFLNGEEIKKNG